MKKQIPGFKTDEEAERFVEEADLTEYDLSQFKPVHFELRRKDRQLNLRLPETLLESIKARAAEKDIPYQRYIRKVLEDSLMNRQDNF
jgi:predicted DNA binding CopG/RHH family protein